MFVLNIAPPVALALSPIAAPVPVTATVVIVPRSQNTFSLTTNVPTTSRSVVTVFEFSITTVPVAPEVAPVITSPTLK